MWEHEIEFVCASLTLNAWDLRALRHLSSLWHATWFSLAVRSSFLAIAKPAKLKQIWQYYCQLMQIFLRTWQEHWLVNNLAQLPTQSKFLFSCTILLQNHSIFSLCFCPESREGKHVSVKPNSTPLPPKCRLHFLDLCILFCLSIIAKLKNKVLSNINFCSSTYMDTPIIFYCK